MILGTFNDIGLAHSYPNTPPEHSDPQILYKYHYEGWLQPSTHANPPRTFLWTIEPPFYIISGQGTSEITVELKPITTNLCLNGLYFETTTADCIEIPTTHPTTLYVNASPNLSYTIKEKVIVSYDNEHKFYANVASYNRQTGTFKLITNKNIGTGTFCNWSIRLDGCENYSNITLQLGKWNEGTIIYYKTGPRWKIEGNTLPKVRMNNGKIVQSIETYTLIPEYDMSGNPPRCSTEPNNYSFEIKGGKIMKFYGGTPPNGNPTVDVFWYQTGATYLTFYSSWKNEETKFPTTLNTYVSVTNEPIPTIPTRIETGGKKLWKHEQRPTWKHSGNR